MPAIISNSINCGIFHCAAECASITHPRRARFGGVHLPAAPAARRARSKTGLAGAPPAVARSASGVSPTASPKAAACTPHSYSQPHKAAVRSIRISRSRGAIELPRTQNPRSELAQPRADFRVAQQRTKQLQRLDLRSRRHPFGQGCGDFRVVRRVQRGDAVAAWGILFPC